MTAGRTSSTPPRPVAYGRRSRTRVLAVTHRRSNQHTPREPFAGHRTHEDRNVTYDTSTATPFSTPHARRKARAARLGLQRLRFWAMTLPLPGLPDACPQCDRTVAPDAKADHIDAHVAALAQITAAGKVTA